MPNVCLKHTCYKHRFPLNKARNHIPKFILVLRAWSVSEGLFGTANWCSCGLTPSGRYSLEQGKGFFGNSVRSAHETTKCGAKELVCQHQGPGDQHLLHGGLKLCKMSPLTAMLSGSSTVQRCWSLTMVGGYFSSSSGCVHNPVKHFGRKQPG